MNAPLQCPQCRALLAAEAVNRSGFAPCRRCGALLRVEIFPALFRRPTPGRAGEALLVEGEASCFYHPDKKAVVPCEACGRFLCALCDCALLGQHLCPACLETGRTKGRIERLENERTLYDHAALSLACYPLLIPYFTAITAPMALFVALRHWNAPRSLVHRTKWRLVAAIVIATLEIAGWGVGLYFFATAFDSHA